MKNFKALTAYTIMAAMVLGAYAAWAWNRHGDEVLHAIYPLPTNRPSLGGGLRSEVDVQAPTGEPIQNQQPLQPQDERAPCGHQWGPFLGRCEGGHTFSRIQGTWVPDPNGGPGVPGAYMEMLKDDPSLDPRRGEYPCHCGAPIVTVTGSMGDCRNGHMVGWNGKAWVNPA